MMMMRDDKEGRGGAKEEMRKFEISFEGLEKKGQRNKNKIQNNNRDNAKKNKLLLGCNWN